MKITILGTGTSQGVPVIGCDCETCKSTDPKDNRLRTSAYIEKDNLKILIDTSVDFRQQMLRHNFNDVDIVLFTHYHVDHILGMDDLRQINQRLDKYIDVYGNEKTIDELSITFRYVFDERLIAHKAVPLVKMNKIKSESFFVKGVEIIPIQVIHGRLPILGYRIGDFAYITDASKIDEIEMEKLGNLEVLILNALRERPHPTHFNIEQAVELTKLLKPKKTFLTHLSHEVKHSVINPKLPENVELAYDGLTLEI